jgi:hypothetical protein
MISHKHKTIFIHIPKCGGQSITHMFLADLGLSWDDKSSLLMRRRRRGEQGPHKLGHLTARDYFRLGYIDEAVFKSYYRFTVVRNPMSRLHSAYNYLGYRDLIGYSHFINDVVMQSLASKDLWYWFLRPQVDFILDKDGSSLVNDCFKLENLKDATETICLRSGISNRHIPYVNDSSKLSVGSRSVRALKLLLRKQLRYSALFEKRKIECDSQTLRLVEDLYKSDYDYFAY